MILFTPKTIQGIIIIFPRSYILHTFQMNLGPLIQSVKVYAYIKINIYFKKMLCKLTLLMLCKECLYMLFKYGIELSQKILISPVDVFEISLAFPLKEQKGEGICKYSDSQVRWRGICQDNKHKIKFSRFHLLNYLFVLIFH